MSWEDQFPFKKRILIIPFLNVFIIRSFRSRKGLHKSFTISICKFIYIVINLLNLEKLITFHQFLEFIFI